MLHHFDDHSLDHVDSCESCDNCLEVRKAADEGAYTKEARMLLRTIIETGEVWKRERRGAAMLWSLVSGLFPDTATAIRNASSTRCGQRVNGAKGDIERAR